MTAHQYFIVAGPMLLGVVLAGLVTIIVGIVCSLQLMRRAVRAMEAMEVARRERSGASRGGDGGKRIANIERR